MVDITRSSNLVYKKNVCSLGGSVDISQYEGETAVILHTIPRDCFVVSSMFVVDETFGNLTFCDFIVGTTKIFQDINLNILGNIQTSTIPVKTAETKKEVVAVINRNLGRGRFTYSLHIVRFTKSTGEMLNFLEV